MKIVKIVGYTFLALFVFFPGLQSLAQSHEVKFTPLPGKNGVALGKIVGITRDRHGAMWFADQTNRCVTRFDGNTLTRYYDPKNVNLPGLKNAECIMADSAGFLWIGYNGMGLKRFDPETNTYTHYEHNADDPESLSSNYVSVMLVDHLGNFWVGSQGGLDRLDQQSGKFIHYHHNASDPSSLSNNNVRSLFEDRQGTLWVGTGFTWDRNNQGGLNRFNRQQNNFTRYLHDPANAHSLIDNKVRAIFEDDHGNLWIGTRGNGIHLLDRKSGRIDRIPINTEGTKGLIRPPVTSPFDHITFITQDATGFVWFGTENAGLIRYDLLTQTSLQYGSNSNITSGFTDNSGFCCYTSPDGPMWVGTGEASVFQVDLFTNIIPEHMSDSLVLNDITEETDSILWMGTQNGLLRADLRNGSVQQFRHHPQNPESLSDNAVVAVVKDSDGMMWLGTQNGLNVIDPRTHTIKRVLHDSNKKESLRNNNVKGIFEDKDHNLWIATYGGGLNRLDKRKEKFISYVNNPADTTSISENLVAGILQGDDGSLWIRTYTSGLNRLDIPTGKFRRYLQGKPARHFFKDSNGVIWVTTDFGIYCYNKETDKFYQPEDLITAFKNEVVNIIAEDHQQNIWMATSNGIYRLDQNNRRLIRLGRETGIYAQFVHTIKVNQKGHLRLINANGYYVLDPNKIMIAPIVPKIHFTNFIVNGELAKVGQNELLKEPFFNTKAIILSYEQNIFSIGVGAIDYSDVATKAAHYKLEGYDKDWRELTSENQVYYFGVPPGTYRFIVTATNRSNGVRVEKSISIIIKPPWWNTIWAYFTYAVVFAATVYGAYRIQKDRLVKIERAKAQVRELEQAREIEKAYSTLKATQAQLIQSEKMASLGELTAGIAHEIQNPLNFVNNFSEVSSELLSEMSQEIEKGNFKEVKTITDDIRKNLEKILHHGKRADGIVKGMLQHSRSSTGVKEPTDINALADEYLRLAYHGFRAKDKSFNVTTKTDFDPVVGKIDVVPQDIGRVILNLITNAFYAVTEKKKQSVVEYEPIVTLRTKRNGDHVLISVMDNGNGIPSKVFDKIFQPFFTTKPTGQGTGLGLSLSYDIVKAHGGLLKVDTKEGMGSEFVIQLPIS